MGFYGPKKLPDVDELYERLFKRKTFRKCPKNTNILFATYLHHFVSQFDNLEECEVTNVIDMWHIYGKKEAATNCLRSFQKGKLKTRYHNDEEFPPLLQDCPQVAKMYPQQPFDLISKILGPSTLKEKWALGNPQLNMTPLLCVISTIWIREHNRVCNVLANKNPHWGDDELYHTARLIVTGEAIKITLTEIMKHLMQSHIDLLYKPEFTSDLNIQHTGCVPRELSLVPLWQCLMPDEIQIGKSSYNCSDLQYSNNIIFQHGINQIIHSMSTTPAGETTNRNIGTGFKKFITKLINESRALKVQSYNNYRKRFGLKPKKTFEELTGDLHLAAMLKEFYIDVDAVELIVGFLTEEKGTGISPPSMTTMGGSWLIRGLLSHPINSPDWWKPKTFGGHLGMNIVKTASLKKLICLNLKDKCHNIYVGLKLPKEDN
ncbi:hypothetical protein RN001_006461 [Aquatica leii]|uniref:Prostaglandin-endoperoxide synthase n=1 Tax=Aquatica leii TaxID=1421715 RepID=A0AAN7SIL1_9COLE|nr:hypothetical protein RN001_006461 [Aquatica leii]